MISLILFIKDRLNQGFTNVKDIQAFDFGNVRGKYIVFIDSNNKAYVLTDDKLNNVSEINVDCDRDGTDDGRCSVFAITKANN